ncbi:MAG TPA: phospholipid carrier-dependent glycosyltransferase, partial [Ignavibacteria bacterium]
MNRFRIWDILLIGLLVFNFISSLIWIYINNAPFPWDQAAHADLSLQIAEHMRSLQLFSVLQVSNYYPILVHALTAIFFLFFGPYLKMTQIIAAVLLLGTIAIIYFYFDLVFKSKKIAFITAFFFSFFPIVYNFSKWLMLDIPIVGFLFLTLYLWEKSKMMTGRKYSLLTLTSLGLLMMTKWTGALFLFTPFTLTAWHFIKEPHKKTMIVTLFYGTTIFLIIVTPWYLTNLQSFLFQSNINVIGEQGADPSNLLTIGNFTRYINDFINSQTTTYFAIPFFIIFTVLLFKKWPRKYFVISMIVISYLIFTFISNKDGRYTMPILPFAAFVVAFGLEKFNSIYRKTGNTLTFFLMFVLLGYYLLLTIRPIVAEGAYLSFDILGIQRFDLLNINDRLVKKYDSDYWEMPNILNDFESISKGTPVNIVIGIEREHLNASTLQTYLETKKYQGRLTNISLNTPDIYYLESTYNQASFPSNKAVKTYLENINYVLLSPNNIGTPYLRNHDALLELRNYTIHNSLSFCNAYID